MVDLSRRAAWAAVLAVSPFALPLATAAAQEPDAEQPPAASVQVSPSVDVAATVATPPASAPAAEPADEAPALSLSLFADAYVSLQTSGSGTPATLSGHRAYTGQGPSGLAENGFGLSWLGFDASYDAGMFAVTGSLRFGTGAAIFHGDSDLAFGVDSITQGYVTWRPVEGLDLDLGMFGTIFGAEVAESWKNLNYTRGALYFYGQPFWHTGLRAKYQLSDMVSLTGIVVNGTNNVSETQPQVEQVTAGFDQSPTIGAQVGITPSDVLSLAVGGMVALDGEENDDFGFDTFLDFVGVISLDPITIVLNADYIVTQSGLGGNEDRNFIGVSGALGYAFSDQFGIAGRLEFLSDDANFDGSNEDKWSLITATATLDYKPVADFPNLIIRWDNRFEKSNQDIFGDSRNDSLDPDDATFTDSWFQSVIGVVVTTSP